MKVTLDLPDALIEEAMSLSNHKTKTAVVTAALEEFVRRIRLQEIRRYKGRVPLDIDLDRLRKRS